MPEGDTIHDAAARLTRAIVGKPLTRFVCTVRGVDGARLAGHAVSSVTARGKWLSVHFDDGRTLVTHLRMTGAWHVYVEGERWRRPAHLARVILAVGAEGKDPPLTAVCFQAPVVRLDTGPAIARSLDHLGPDVMTAEFEPAAAVAGLRALSPETAIGEALLDQRALAGVGNVFKSESLFAERTNPFASVGSLDDPTLLRVTTRAHALMRRNAGGAPRKTTTSLTPARYAVYRRYRLPCPRCGYPIARGYQGSPGRSTYYCPRCQGVA